MARHRPLRTLLAAVLLACAGFAVAADDSDIEYYGKPLPAGPTVAISQAVSDFDAHAAAPARFSGRIVAVCQMKGCWAMLEDDGKAARVTFMQNDFHVPRDVTGQAEVYGTLKKVQLTPAQVKHLQDENPGMPVSDVEYRIAAEGIRILG